MAPLSGGGAQDLHVVMPPSAIIHISQCRPRPSRWPWAPVSTDTPRSLSCLAARAMLMPVVLVVRDHHRAGASGRRGCAGARSATVARPPRRWSSGTSSSRRRRRRRRRSGSACRRSSTGPRAGARRRRSLATGSECSTVVWPSTTMVMLCSNSEPPSGTTIMPSWRARLDELLALVAAGLVVALDAERPGRLQPAQVRHGVVQALDLGGEGRGGAVEDGAGREDARGDHQAGLAPSRCGRRSRWCRWTGRGWWSRRRPARRSSPSSAAG